MKQKTTMPQTRNAERWMNVKFDIAKEAFRKAGWKWPSANEVRSHRTWRTRGAVAAIAQQSLTAAYAASPIGDGSFFRSRTRVR